jgi:hypothetical protein
VEYCVSETTLERIFIHFANEDPRLNGAANADGLVSTTENKKNKSKSQAISAVEQKGDVPTETTPVTIHHADADADDADANNEIAPVAAEEEIAPAEEEQPAEDVAEDQEVAPVEAAAEDEAESEPEAEIAPQQDV